MSAAINPQKPVFPSNRFTIERDRRPDCQNRITIQVPWEIAYLEPSSETEKFHVYVRESGHYAHCLEGSHNLQDAVELALQDYTKTWIKRLADRRELKDAADSAIKLLGPLVKEPAVVRTIEILSTAVAYAEGRIVKDDTAAV